MCGRFNNSHLTDVINPDDSEIMSSLTTVSYNVKPTQFIPILYKVANQWQGASARWWLIPSWHKGDLKDWKATTFNAKYEEAQSKPSFRPSWYQHRCLIPMKGYYEWTGEKGKKQPWYIEPQSNSEKQYFAGLYSVWQEQFTVTILTRPANAEIDYLHTRMPVIPSDVEINPWINGEELPDLGASTRFRAHQVKPFGMNDDGEELIEPFEMDAP